MAVPVGYMSYQGDMDMCIAIRTAVIQNGKLYAPQAGAGSCMTRCRRRNGKKPCKRCAPSCERPRWCNVVWMGVRHEQSD